MLDINIIHTTNKYDFFLIDGNREIKSVKIKNLTESIKKYGLINPININLDKNIIDGQHRFLSCKDKEIVSLIRDINSVQSNWNNKDIGYAYSIHANNRDSYKKYIELVNMGVSHSTVIESCGMLTIGDKKSSSYYHDFKNGTLLITDAVKNRVASQIKMLADSNIDKKIWNRIYFMRSLLKLRKQEDFKTYQFIDNFNKYPQKWIPAYTVSENIKSIIVMHNYNSRNKAKYYFV